MSQSIHEIFSQRAKRHASQVAVERGTQRLTYRELEDESNRLANFLIDSGATKGAIVPIMADDPIRVLTAIIAVLKANCAFAPFDPRLPLLRLKSMTGQIEPHWFITEIDHAAKITELVPSSTNVITLDGELPS